MIGPIVCVAYLLVFAVAFFYAAHIFKSTAWSFKSFEVLFPSLGGALLAIFLLFKTSLGLYQEKETYLGHMNLLVKNKVKIEPFSPLSDELDPNLKQFTAYTQQLFASTYIENYIEREAVEKDYVDVVEYILLERIGNGWILPNEEMDFITEKLSFPLSDLAKVNGLVQISKDQVDKVNKKLGFNNRSDTFRSDLEKLSISLPKDSEISYQYKDEWREISFNNRFYDLKIRVFSGGMNNFHPRTNPFHFFLVNVNGHDYEKDEFSLRKVFISFEYNLSKYVELTDDKKKYQEYFRTLKDKFNNQMNWNDLKEHLQKMYLIKKD